MGELQLGLVSIGALVVAGVFVYNKWQERRYQRDAEAAFASRHADVLMRSDGGPGQAEDRENSPGSGRVEPALESFDGAQDGAPSSGQILTESLDFIIPIETPEEVSGAALLDAAGSALDRCPRSVHLEGFDEGLSTWELLNPDRRYSKMRAGLQLVDRRGPADAEELATFANAVEGAAGSLGALATMPDPAPALARARELDHFCGEVDIRIAVHVVTDAQPFPGAEVDIIARAAGFELDESEGKFRCRDDAGQVICALANFEPIPFTVDSLETLSTHAVTLEMDVPRTPRGAFAHFRHAAQVFAQRLNARVVDDNRQTVSPGAFEAIGVQLQAVHRSMEAHGIAPGGPLALRLFS